MQEVPAGLQKHDCFRVSIFLRGPMLQSRCIRVSIFLRGPLLQSRCIKRPATAGYTQELAEVTLATKELQESYTIKDLRMYR